MVSAVPSIVIFWYTSVDDRLQVVTTITEIKGDVFSTRYNKMQLFDFFAIKKKKKKRTQRAKKRKNPIRLEEAKESQ